MGGSGFVSPRPGSLVGGYKDGSPRTGQIVSANANGSSNSVTVTCLYEDGAGNCVYDGDGTFENGSSACPDGTEATPPSSTTIIQTSTQIQTQTQTQILTQTVQSVPPSSTSAPPTSTPSSTSSLTSPSASSSQPSLSASSAPPTSSAPIATQTNDTGLSGSGVMLSSTKSVTAGAIAGIVVGSIIVLILAIVLALCVRRRRKRRSMTSLAPESYLVVNPASTSESTPTRMTENSRHLSVSDVSQQRQEYLAGRLRAVQKELEALQASVGTGGEHLEQAMRQNEALRARIRMLEREMHSQWGLGLTDSPPGYLD
ncbi:hypothetical protein MSAN_02066600 [Mycena sanguinolenta]|uniref:Uncharacterized protein n=1 Tax=Mycena sanguinolenta TaxID=230812 RepID=A0A8H7CNE7_9AGAR|nr:hypothetical protein MSAN_02066600 [Mycena sanguinolenta]